MRLPSRACEGGPHPHRNIRECSFVYEWVNRRVGQQDSAGEWAQWRREENSSAAARRATWTHAKKGFLEEDGLANY